MIKIIEELKHLFLYFFFITLFSSCNNNVEKSGSAKLFNLLDPDETGVNFINEVKDQDQLNVLNYRNFYNGNGVAIGDINNDSLPDIYFASNLGKNKLYLNKGNFEFEDITEHAGVGGSKSWSTGVTMADINGDGWLDIYVCNSDVFSGENKENECFINNGDLTFKESASQFGLNNSGNSVHASFFDYDIDGDLDCYILNNSYKSIDSVQQFLMKREDRDNEGGDKLLRNDGNIFTDVTEEAGIYSGWIGFGLGVSVSDLNGDMYPDIYISNDFWERDYLYINKGNGTFSEELVSRTTAVSGSSMGADIADLNNDGSVEIFTTEMLPGDNLRLRSMTHFEETNIDELKVRSSYHYQFIQNCLHLNDGLGNFQETAFLSNVATTDWSWGALIFDMENDGWKDIFVCNGIYRDITSMDFADFVSNRENVKKMVVEKGNFDVNDLLAHLPSTKIPNYAFINQRNNTFKNLSDSLGLANPSFSNGAAYGDLDSDGDLDLVINNVNMPSFIYRNNSEKLLSNNYLKVNLIGPKNNTSAIGAKVFIYAKGNQQVLQNFSSRGYESSTEPKLLFGLGKVGLLDSIIIIWPDQKKQVLKNIKANQVLTLSYNQADDVFKQTIERPQSIFDDVTDETLRGNIVHKENEFNDFDFEHLLPKKISTEGPKIITGDLTGDDLDDFILLGAFGDYDKLFVQQKSGQFVESLQSSLLSDSSFESTCGVFFDPDNDGDKDILIGSGGNEYNKGVQAHLLRFYRNDGKGNFTKNIGYVPSVAGNFSCILAEDFDQDGDEDLFIGGRCVPGNYGLIPRSFLFRNEADNWVDITPLSLGGAGMVTDAIWSDVDLDSKKDLIVVGDWMPVKIFKNLGTSLNEASAIKNTDGWWNRIVAADLNKDGVEDFVLGNWGLNSKFTASIEKPLTMYVNDFDNNGKSEFIINWYPPEEDKSFPFVTKPDISTQIPSINKIAPGYEDFSKMTYEDLFPEQIRKNAHRFNCYVLSSSILWNNGNLNFDLEPLPLETQVSPVFAINTFDYDNDRISDIWLGGNFYGLKYELGRLNSSNGILLKGIGNGQFEYINNKQSGFKVEGEIRDSKLIQTRKGEVLFIARNNNSLMCFKSLVEKVVQ